MSSEVTGWAFPGHRAIAGDRRDWYRRRISACAESAISRLRSGAELRARTTTVAIVAAAQARRASSRTASMLGVVSLGPRREPAGTVSPSCKPGNHARQALYRVQVFQQAARDSELLDVWDISRDSELQKREPLESAKSPPPDSDPSLSRPMGFAAKPEQSRLLPCRVARAGPGSSPGRS